jgi:hypothetical protein
MDGLVINPTAFFGILSQRHGQNGQVKNGTIIKHIQTFGTAAMPQGHSSGA